MRRTSLFAALVAVALPAFAITVATVPPQPGSNAPPVVGGAPPATGASAAPAAAGGSAARAADGKAAARPSAPKAALGPATGGWVKDAGDHAGMRRGTVQKVDLARGAMQIHGTSIAFDPKKVRVVGADGKPTSAYALRAGADVRFTLDPTDPARRRAAVIYLR